jgi:hypothetical protein
VCFPYTMMRATPPEIFPLNARVTVNPNLSTKRRPHVPPVLVVVTQQTLVSRQQLACQGFIGFRLALQSNGKPGMGLTRLRALAMQVLRVSRPRARMRGVGEGA